MTKKHSQRTSFIAAITAVLCCFGCSLPSWKTCESNAEHKAQSGCTCPCNNNSNAAVCSDPNNVCCYDSGGSCKTTTTQTPSGSSGAAGSMAPSNKDGVRAAMLRCVEKEGDCTNFYPAVPCQKFYERVGYQNFSDVVQAPPDQAHTPIMQVSAAFGTPYSFTFPPTTVPWTSLSVGQGQAVPIEIRALNSAGVDGPGLDPGANQCVDSGSFTVQLLGVQSLTLDPNGVLDSLIVEGSPSQPFGACTKGSGC